MIKMKSTRKFNGKTYYYDSAHTSKQKAENRAKDFKTYDNSMTYRIVKLNNYKIYALYVRYTKNQIQNINR